MKQSLKKSTRQKYEFVKMLRDNGPLSRHQLSDAFEIALPTVSVLIKELQDAGLVRPEGRKKSSGGRPPELVGINPDYGVVIGAEISYRRIACALVNALGEPVTEIIDENASSLNANEALAAMERLAGSLIEQTEDKRIIGAGIGVSGIIEDGNRVTRRQPNSVSWESVPLADWFEERFEIRPLVTNNVSASALGEARSGAWGEAPDLVFLHVGRGIAAGLTIGGRLYPGAGGNAGEIGHFVINPEGPLCYCGNRGCLESVASADVIVANCREAVQRGCMTELTEMLGPELENLTLDDMLEAARKGDKLAVTLLEEAGGHIGRAAANMVNLINPGALVLGGLLAEEGTALAETIERAFRSTVLSALRSSTKVGYSRLREHACVAGASLAVLDRWFASPGVFDDIASNGHEDNAAM